MIGGRQKSEATRGIRATYSSSSSSSLAFSSPSPPPFTSTASLFRSLTRYGHLEGLLEGQGSEGGVTSGGLVKENRVQRR